MMIMIEPLSRTTSGYLEQFSVCAICITSGAEIVIASPASLGRASAVCAWWTRDRRAGLEVVQAIGRRARLVDRSSHCGG
jgi:hypothetical protein